MMRNVIIIVVLFFVCCQNSRKKDFFRTELASKFGPYKVKKFKLIRERKTDADYLTAIFKIQIEDQNSNVRTITDSLTYGITGDGFYVLSHQLN